MKKRVGLMTSEESFMNNYGAALQGYALYSTIRDFGYDCDIIRYEGRSDRTQRKSSLLNSCKRMFSGSFKQVYQKLHAKDLKERELLFAGFQKDNMTFYKEERLNYHRLLENPPEYDSFVCGSDQIWNPTFRNGKNDYGYFLNFAPEGRKRIAYAPSIGVSSLPQGCKEDMKELIEKFHAISVREAEGAKIVKELTGKDVPVCLDPTLIRGREDWKEISRMPDIKHEKYILFYRFGGEKITDEKVKSISKKLGLPVIVMPLFPKWSDMAYTNELKVGPREFLGLIKNASFVCTESFHATVFSIIFSTPFLSFPRKHLCRGVKHSDSRIHTLLGFTGLEKRFVYSDDDMDFDSMFQIDFEKAHQAIDEKRKNSLQYLREALEDGRS